jgi:malonyl-CoA/methylmalonyl-CoA synthetase
VRNRDSKGIKIGTTLTQLLDQARPEDPDAVFLLEPDGSRTTYRQAWSASLRYAGALRAMGVQPGDRVALQLPKSSTYVLLYLACLRAGFVVLPMNPAYTRPEVEWILHDAEPAVHLTETQEIEERAEEAELGWDGPEPTGEMVAALLYTSGTTGRPKGAQLPQSALAANGAALHQAWGFRPGDVVLHCLPVFHTHGLFVALSPAMLNGSAVVFLPRFEAGAVIEALPGSTVFMGVPTFYTRLLADPSLDSTVCRGVRLFTCGSAPLLAGTHHAFKRRTGHDIVERYGLTETNIVTTNPLDVPRPGSVGRPLPHTQIRLAPAPSQDRGGAEVGEVEVRGPGLMTGYRNRSPSGDGSFTPDGWFRTGDLGRLDQDGYLVLVGRSKDLVISGGLNVYPSEVEAVLDAWPGVQESAVVGLPDPDLGEVVTAVVVPAEGSGPDVEELRRWARSRLAGFKVPKRIVLRPDLPRNAMGKVEKSRLRQELAPPEA